MPKESTQGGQDRNAKKMHKILEENATTTRSRLAALLAELQKILDAVKAHQKKVSSSKSGNKADLERRAQELKELRRKQARLLKLLSETLRRQEEVAKTLIKNLR